MSSSSSSCAPARRVRPRRKGVALAVLAALAVIASGCISIRSQTTFQREPGVVSLQVDVCASDRNRSHYADCDPETGDPDSYDPDTEDPRYGPRNTAEQDNRRIDADIASGNRLGQLLIGFRVPDGSSGPPNFLSDNQDVSFTASPSFTAELTEMRPPPEGFHWEGYISTAKVYNRDMPGTFSTSFTAEFTLPPGSGGAPFASPFRWRALAGFRSLSDASQSGDPVVCDEDGFDSDECFDTPRTDQLETHLEAVVSDFGVSGAAKATTGQSSTATLIFPIRYDDAGGMGERAINLIASTTVPGGSTKLAAATVTAPPNSTTPVAVEVSVPAGTPLGSYEVRLRAATGSPEVVRSATGTIEVVDRIAPTIQIATPADGATFTVGDDVKAQYSCAEELNGSGIATCAGPVGPGAAIDTGSPGTKTFTVNATDHAANAASATRTYTVVAPPPGRISFALSHNYSATRKATRFTNLRLRKLPKGARVTVKCRPRRKCPRKARTFTKKRTTKRNLRLRRFEKKRFKRGARIEIRVTQKGKIGSVKRIKIRRRKAPKITTLCLPVGAKKPVKRC